LEKLFNKEKISLLFTKKGNIKYFISFFLVLAAYFSYTYIKGPVVIVFLIFAMLGILLIFNIPSKWVEDGFSKISYRFKISSAITGGFFLAIASSAPEFFTAISGVVYYKIFSIGFDTIIWSAIFNLCVIIGIGTFYKNPLLVRKSILRRDMPFLGIAIFLLLILALDGVYSKFDFIILVSAYIIYISFLHLDKSKSYRAPKSDFSWKSVIIKISLGIFLIAFLAHLMVSIGQETIGLFEEFYGFTLPIGVLACTIYGPGTSIADLFMSIAAIKKGEQTAAIVNGISSNTFDLTICIGIPGLAYTFLTGNEILINLNESMLIISMLLFSFILVFLVLRNGKVTIREGLFLLLYFLSCMVVYLIYIF
jgi:cation:H+ antiporter